MNHRSLLIVFFSAVLVIGSVAVAFAQSGEGSASGAASDQGTGSDVSTPGTPWLKGVNIPPVPEGPAPICKVDILLSDGSALPATVSEDVALHLACNSELLGDKPPLKAGEVELKAGEWTQRASVNWFFDDVGKNKSTLASCSDNLPANQMKVIPVDPCRTGRVTVHVSRPMKYQEANGQYKTVWANGGHALMVNVSDITPPCCGMKVSAGGFKGSLWTVENPANGPAPKKAEVVVEGDLVSEAHTPTNKQVNGLDLGPSMALTPDQAALYLPKAGPVSMELILADNDKVDDQSVKYGLCEYANGMAKPIGQPNQASFDPSKVPLPKGQVYLYVEAKDVSGNHGAIFVPVVFK